MGLDPEDDRSGVEHEVGALSQDTELKTLARTPEVVADDL